MVFFNFYLKVLAIIRWSKTMSHLYNLYLTQTYINFLLHKRHIYRNGPDTTFMERNLFQR